MTIEIVMPKIGLNMEEGMIVDWVKKEGDTVKRGDVLFILETDKVTVESEAQQDGTLVKILVKKGERVPVKTPVALMTAEEEPYTDISRNTDRTAENKTHNKPITAPVSPPPTRAKNGKVLASPKAKLFMREHGINPDEINVSANGPIKFHQVSGFSNKSVHHTGQVRATPLAKRIAKKTGLDLAAVVGTGSMGRINKHDIESTLNIHNLEQKPMPSKSDLPFNGVRAVIAERMLRSSQSTAAVTLHTEVDATRMVEFRHARKAKGESIVPSYNAFLISLVAITLNQHREMNAQISGGNIVFPSEINVGLAVDRPDGLRVVVVKAADQKSTEHIQADLVNLIDRVQTNRSTPDDFSGGTFTITNLGEYGIDRFTPIINPPEIGILGVGQISEKLVIRDGKVIQRSMVSLSLTFDHRAIDGAPAARFLQTLANLIENFQ
jgi:pyruvate dehydrogenase E2 component (dihydrolipoamide acetyltransferase)